MIDDGRVTARTPPASAAPPGGTVRRMVLACRVINAAGWAIGGVLGVGILFVLGQANEGNVLVDVVLDVGRFFADPFRQMFVMDDDDLQIAANWSIAAAVYIVLAIAIAALVRTSHDRLLRRR